MEVGLAQMWELRLAEELLFESGAGVSALNGQNFGKIPELPGGGEQQRACD
jgi:hypothetical protein